MQAPRLADGSQLDPALGTGGDGTHEQTARSAQVGGQPATVEFTPAKLVASRNGTYAVAGKFATIRPNQGLASTKLAVMRYTAAGVPGPSLR